MKKNWWRGLRTKIIGWSFVPTVIILSAVAWFTFFSYQMVLIDQAIKQDRDVVQSKATQVGKAMSVWIDPILIPLFLDTMYHNGQPLAVRAQNILDRAEDIEAFDGGSIF